MADIVLRPSTKFILAGLLAVLLVILAALIVYTSVMRPLEQPPWLPLASLLLLYFPLRSWIAQRTIRATLTGDKLRVETGFFAKSTRIIQLAKIQDVRVNQSLIQRIFNVGDVAIETAGEASRLVLPHFDRPNAIAEEILAASSHHAGP
ncbi:MAG TPA: PH domain-containing protein [Bryobacteraceae bacterium]|nr:PH domain-containing protein [Bryobacteraceae bacterium]